MVCFSMEKPYVLLGLMMDLFLSVSIHPIRVLTPGPALARRFRFDRRWPDLLGLLGHLGGDFGKFGAHGRGEIEHLYAFGFDADLFQNTLNVLYFFTGSYISFQEMAFSLQSPRHIDGVCPAFYGPQQVDNVDSPAARHLDDFDIGRVVQAHGAGQIPGRICAVFAAIGNDLGFETFTHLLFLSAS